MQLAVHGHTFERGLHRIRVDSEIPALILVLGGGDGERRKRNEHNVLTHCEDGSLDNEKLMLKMDMCLRNAATGEQE